MHHRHAPALDRSLAPSALAIAGLAIGAFLAGCAQSRPPTTGSAPAPAHAPAAGAVDPSEAIERLLTGNARFVQGGTQHPRQTPERRSEVAKGQRPFAVVIACADSRLSPEIIFDQGLGDLFVVRVAGNVVDDHAIGSVEYAVEHLHASTILVLGHQRCGAVAAARDTIAARARAPGHVHSLVEAIRPAVDATPGADAETTCKTNVQHVVAALKDSPPVLRRMSVSGELAILGAYYELDSGLVTLLNER